MDVPSVQKNIFDSVQFLTAVSLSMPIDIDFVMLYFAVLEKRLKLLNPVIIGQIISSTIEQLGKGLKVKL